MNNNTLFMQKYLNSHMLLELILFILSIKKPVTFSGHGLR